MRFAPKFAGSAALALLFGAAAAAQQTFTAATDAVVVDVLVQRNGAPVAGLTADDFLIKDTGVAQKASLLAVDALPVRLLLVLDTSASVRGEPLALLKQAAAAAVQSLRPNDEAALLSFAHTVSRPIAWTTNRAEVLKAIEAVTARGSTALVDATFGAIGLAPKPGTRTLILVFTDGSDTASWLSPEQVLRAARRSESIVYGVSAGAAASLPELDQLDSWMLREPSLYRGALLPLLSRHSGGEALRAGDMKALGATFVSIVSRFNQRYVLSYSPTGVSPGGWHPIEVEVKGGGDVIARRGYER